MTIGLIISICAVWARKPFAVPNTPKVTSRTCTVHVPTATGVTLPVASTVATPVAELWKANALVPPVAVTVLVISPRAIPAALGGQVMARGL